MATHTVVLFRMYRRTGDGRVREALVERYLPLARSLARRYARSSEPYEDLVQVASLALVKAVDRFDPDRGAEFRAFAIPTILGELKRHFRDAAWAIHVPRSIQERALAVEAAAERLASRHGRAPTVREIAQELHVSPEEVHEGLMAAEAYGALSLDESRASRDGSSGDSDQTTVGETLGAEDERYELIEAAAAIAQALHAVPERERRILYLRFVREMTQGEIATRMGLSQMQISRLLRRALGQLRALAGEPAEAL